MKIPNNRLDIQFEMYKTEYLNKVQAILESGWYVLGPEVEQFEKEFANYHNIEYCVGLASGLDALVLSFDILKLNPGDEVIVPANTYIATIMGITRNGLVPVFVEPDEYYNLDAEKIEASITNKTKAICVVHLYGQIANMPKIMEIAKRYNLYVVEDAAQAHGASIQGKKAGTWGDIGCFSFYPTKNLGGFGDGGAILTSNYNIANDFIMLRNYGSRTTYYFDRVGYNSRLDELQAGLLRVKLQYLDTLNLERQSIALQYLREIKNNKVKLPKLQFGDEGHIFHLFVVEVENRKHFIEYCENKGIGTKIHYPQPPHLSKAYEALKYQDGDFPITESMANQVISLPLFNGMTSSEIEYVINAINNY